MAANYSTIQSWVFDALNIEGCTHLIVVCDTYDYEDYPVVVNSGMDVKEVIADYNDRGMQRVMEVYSFTNGMSIQEQMQESRAWHID